LRICSFSVLDDVLLPFGPNVHRTGSSSSRGFVSWIGGSYPQGAEDLVCGGGFAEPLLENVERAGVGFVAVGLARVGDDDRRLRGGDTLAVAVPRSNYPPGRHPFASLEATQWLSQCCPAGQVNRNTLS
jgi:hypothetical protein